MPRNYVVSWLADVHFLDGFEAIKAQLRHQKGGSLSPPVDKKNFQFLRADI
ncbi:hypothetical protein RB2150_07223 [Rhodobacterales bacterium HTCC2150]|nr:hypothetical protein RB2150_07223 [Rhodobacterales bacterium HTCC2150] [Rhodobacteraceae bacterium HTCC2150]